MQIRPRHYWTCLIWGSTRRGKSPGKQTSDAVAQSTQEINLVNCQICKHVNWSRARPVTEVPNHCPRSMNVSAAAQTPQRARLLSHQPFNVIGIQRSVL